MTVEPLVPLVSEIINAGVNATVALRPAAAPFVVSGVYGNIFAGWRAQLRILLVRLSDEVSSTRSPTAEGEALRQWLASELDADVETTAQTSSGSVSIKQTSVTTSATPVFSTGVIPAGKRFQKISDPTAVPPVLSADYVTTQAVHVTTENVGDGTRAGDIIITTTGPVSGDYTHTQTVTLPITATISGAHANTPTIAGQTNDLIVLNDTLPDMTDFLPSNGGTAIGVSAGGSTGQSDEDMRRLGRALSTGRFGPTEAAAIAGALSEAGVKHVAALEDSVYGRTILYIADESWAYSSELLRYVKRRVKEEWTGFGCKIDVRGITNYLVAASATILLVDQMYVEQNADIAAAASGAIQQYFDDRDDFYIWRTTSLGGVIASADKLILTCLDSPTPKVLDIANSSAVLSEPAAITSSMATVPHYMLAGARFSFVGPS